jgi:hypothetical protein
MDTHPLPSFTGGISRAGAECGTPCMMGRGGARGSSGMGGQRGCGPGSGCPLPPSIFLYSPIIIGNQVFLCICVKPATNVSGSKSTGPFICP